MPFVISLLAALMGWLGLFDGPGAGGGGDEGAGDGSGTPAAPPADSAPNSGAPAGQGTEGAAATPAGDAAAAGDRAPPQQGTKLTDPAKLASELDEARRQTAAERQKRTTAETQRSQALEAFKPIAKLLGFDTGEEPDPAQLQSKLEQTQAELRAEKVNNAFFRVASQVGANPGLTLRYLRGGNELDDLDPAKPEFESALKTIVQAAVSQTPQLKASPQAGGSFDGGSLGGGQPAEPEDLAGLIAQRVSQQRRNTTQA